MKFSKERKSLNLEDSHSSILNNKKRDNYFKNEGKMNNYKKHNTQHTMASIHFCNTNENREKEIIYM